MEEIHSHTGFSLIELLVVLITMSTMMLIGMATYLNWLPDINFRKDSRQMLNDFHYARGEAIKNNNFVSIVFTIPDCSALPSEIDEGFTRYTIFLDNGDGGGNEGNGIQDGAESTLKVAQTMRHVGICNDTGDASSYGGTVTFQANGLPSAAGHQAIQNTKGLSSYIDVSISGNIKIED